MTFNEWMQRTGFTSRVAAEHLGVSRETVNGLRKGTRSPDLRTAALVEQRTRDLNPRQVVHYWEMLDPAVRLSIYGAEMRP